MVRVFDWLRVSCGLRTAAALLVLGVGGCSSWNDFSSSDITEVASSGLATITGTASPEEANEDIELRARHPLVLPPDYNLRPPVDPEQEDQQLGTAWPEDPDVKAKELAALEKARREAEFKKISEKPGGLAAPLTPEELAAGMVDPRTISPEPEVQLARVWPGEALSSEELLEKHRLEQQAGQSGAGPQLVVASREPTMEEPVDGIQYQTQEVGESQAPAPPPKKKDFWDRLVFWE